MTDIRRYSLAAVVLLVILRLSIGWQLLYEGLWKIDTLQTARPWTSAGYLKNSVGPMRNAFRNMAGDPNDLAWLDYDTVAGRWQDWANRFEAHYRLDEKQAGSLYRLLHGAQRKIGDRMAFSQPLAKLPSGVDKLNVSEKIVWFDAKAKKLHVDAGRFLLPNEKTKLAALVKDRDDKEAAAYLDAVNRLFDRQKKGMGYLKQLQGTLRGDPELIGNEQWQRVGKAEQYRQQLAEYEADYAKASTAFEWDHLKYNWKKIQTLRAELVGPVKAMESSLKEDASKLLTLDQRQRGAVSQPMTMLRLTDSLTIIGLTLLGFMLITGLFSRFAALVAAFMLFNFYLAMPPLPGVPPLPGPEHSFVINKNLIEVIALLALATVPTGMWFGLDALLSKFFRNWRADRSISSSLKSTVAAGGEPTETPETGPVAAT